MELTELYPLKFAPIYQYRIWGGRRLAHLTSKPLPANDPVGEAWILSDRDDHPSKVTNGKLRGKTIKQLLQQHAGQIFGDAADKYQRFPLLLKFLDCKEVLSVQVHPSDRKKDYIPPGENGKTESWVVLEAGKHATIYAGLKKGVTENGLRRKLEKHKVANELASFSPDVGDCVLIKAGTVHTLSDVVVFEVQENSDVTYRLYDWDRVDKKTGKPRDLQVEQAIACVDFKKTNIRPQKPKKKWKGDVLKELLVEDKHFKMWRHTGKEPFSVGKKSKPRVLVNISGEGTLKYDDKPYLFKKGEVMLLPAAVGSCEVAPEGKLILLEVGI